MQSGGPDKNHVSKGQGVGMPDLGLNLGLSLQDCYSDLSHHAHQY